MPCAAKAWQEFASIHTRGEEFVKLGAGRQPGAGPETAAFQGSDRCGDTRALLCGAIIGQRPCERPVERIASAGRIDDGDREGRLVTAAPLLRPPRISASAAGDAGVAHTQLQNAFKLGALVAPGRECIECRAGEYCI